MQIDRRHFLASACLTAGTAALGQASAESTRPFTTSPEASEAKAPPLPAIGSYLKLPEVTLLDGSVFRPDQAQGRVLVVYWWASYCPFCAQQSPEIQKLWTAHKDQGSQGLQLLTLSSDSKPELAQAYLKKTGFNFPAGFVTPDVRRVMPKPKGLPITLVRGRDGKVLQAEKGQLFPEDIALLAQWL